MSQYGKGISNSGPGGFIQTLTGNSGGPVSPTAGNINVVGTGVITVVGDPGTSTLTVGITGTTNHAVQVGNASGSLTSIPVGLTGEVLTGVTGGDPVFAALPPVAAIETINGDFGSVTGSVVSILGSSAGSSVSFSGAATTMTLDVTDSNSNTIVGESSGNGSISGVNNTSFGAFSVASLSSGQQNTHVGHSAAYGLTSGTNNVSVGYQSMAGGNVTSNNNTAVGSSSCYYLSSGASNSSFGSESLANCNSGSFNTAFGALASYGTTSGSYNCSYGYNAGSGNSGSSSSNICINNNGAAESNTLRIGAGTGTGNQQLNAAYIYGIDGTSTNNISSVVIIDQTTEKLGTIGGGSVTLNSGSSNFVVNSGLSVDSTGRSTNAVQPCFLASQTSDQSSVTGDGTVYTVTFTNEIFDQNNNFNGTSTFTAPITGNYLFCVGLQVQGLTAAMTNDLISVVTTAATYRLVQGNFFATSITGLINWSGSVIANMTVGDTAIVRIQCNGGTKVVTIPGSTANGFRSPYFSGTLLC